MNQYVHTAHGLASYLHIKVLVAGILTWLAHLFETVSPLFDMHGYGVLVVVILWFGDFFSGMIRAHREGKKIKFSHGLRRSLQKAVEYIFIAGTAALIANGFGHLPYIGGALEHLGVLALLIIALTEGASIIENVSTAKRIRKMLAWAKIVLRVQQAGTEAIIEAIDEDDKED